MDTAQWPQESGEMEIKSNNMDQDHDHQMGSNARSAMEKRARPQEQLNCPRCNSTNTKFCYYNNYSLTQPRYFCKTCRRYWTEGGTLRNVPVGGGSRKNKKSSSASTTPSSSGSISSSKNNNNNNNSINIPDLNPPSLFSSSSHQNPRNGHHEGRDLNLTFNAMEHHYPQNAGSGGASASSAAPLSAMELLRTGIASRGVNSFIPTQNMADHPNALYSTTSSTAGGFSLQEFKPANLGFCLDGLGNRYGEDHENMNNGGRILFPFGDHLKPISSASGHHQQVLDHQNKGQGNPNGYWNGLIGGGSW